MDGMLIFDPLNRFMWSLAIILLFINGFLYLNKGWKTQHKESRYLIIGMGFLIIGLAFSRLFYFISDYYRTGYYDGHIYRAASGGDPYLFNLFGKIATLSFLFGMLLFFVCFEYSSKKTYYIPFFFNVFNIIWLIFSSYIFETIATYLGFAFNGLVLIFILLWYTKKSFREIQFLSIFLLTGISLYMIGSVFDSGLLKDLELFSPTIPSIFIILGTLTSMLSIIVRPKNYERIKFLFISLIILLLSSLCFAIITSINVILKINDNYVLLVAIWIAFITATILFIYTLARLKYSLDLINGKQFPKKILESFDLLTPFLFQDSKGNINIISESDADSLSKINDLGWDPGEKEEFLKYYFSISPKAREEILNEMLISNQLDEKESIE